MATLHKGDNDIIIIIIIIIIIAARSNKNDSKPGQSRLKGLLSSTC